ncbi:uncharacterized protein [Solanum lycopersicum]|uniref:Uncharacterized protein n=1 Tax=Solanum lycopersicum TaxID=4081 RepID=A0A3Q7EFL8_SOLLC|nr:uncharacterized transmembrane protein DDB_G0289901 [Solanum lycopersicum]
MNSNYGKSGSSMNRFDFDLGMNSGRSRSLNDQKNKTSSYSSSSSSYTYSSTQSKPNSGSSWTQPNKSSWTHQPVGSLSGPNSMAGDIFGKSWGSSAPSTTSNVASSVGMTNKNPNLFGDLVSSALGGNKSSSNAPLKNAAPTANKSAFSMGGMTDNLPKSGNSVKTGGSWGSAGNSGSGTAGGSWGSAGNSGSGNAGGSWGSVGNSGSGNAGGYNAYNYTASVNQSGGNTKTPNLGGTSLKNMSGSGVGEGMGVNKDPFGSLVDFSSKPGPNMKSDSKETKKNSSGDDVFGNFQNATKSDGPGFPSDPFPTSNTNASPGLNTGGAYSKVDDFGFTNTQSQPSATQSSGVGDFDSLFSSTNASSGEAAGGSENQQFTGGDDWGFESEFVGANDSSGTTEIEGLPPPPSGVSASAAKNKGMDNHKQGQYGDAIKWLSWAVILLEKAGDEAGVMEVLSSRASCYKEVGEYKKAVADCTKVLEQDGKNVSVLVQRALLYESMEKYKLGAEDLRTVMKIDPGNRVARSTVHRLTKMAG